MNDQQARDPDPADEANDQAPSEDDAEGRTELTPSEAPRSIVARRFVEEPSAGLPLVLPPAFWQTGNDSGPAAFRADSLHRRAVALAAAAVCFLALGSAAFVIVDHHRQAGLLAERAQENARLAETVSALNARLQTIETAKGRDELAELRRSVGDMKTAAVSSRELSAAIAQLSQRVERLDRRARREARQARRTRRPRDERQHGRDRRSPGQARKAARVAAHAIARGPAAEIRCQRLDGPDRLHRPVETDPSRLCRARRAGTTSP